MISDKKIANAVSGKTARACDCCIRKRARWYCPADDAFLCQTCDGTVHTANSLARRHERVRLKTASLKRASDDHHRLDLPSWHRGLTRRPRTPRLGKHQSKSKERNSFHVIVPELGMEDTTSSQDGEMEEQLLYRVPIYDPFATDFHSSPTVEDNSRPLELEGGSDVAKSTLSNSKLSPDNYMPSDMDLEEFAADVETLLGKGLDDELYGIEELGLLDCSPSIININENDICKLVKEENELCDEGDMIRGCEILADSNNVVIKDPFELSFAYDDHDFGTTWVDEKDHKNIMMIEQSMVNSESCKIEENDETENIKRSNKIVLRLDYEAISDAWASQGSPWVNGQRPEISPDDCWPHCMGTCGLEGHHQLFGDHQLGGTVGNGGIGDGGREARVSRYREKRRTRLFSKKIRYEVRKLNAEKRPRMKGRFVKRASFAAANTAFTK